MDFQYWVYFISIFCPVFYSDCSQCVNSILFYQARCRVRDLELWVQNIYSVSKTLIGLARNETNDELLFPRLDFFSRDQREVSCLAEAVGRG